MIQNKNNTKGTSPLRIMLINGSPRKDGNTQKILDIFTQRFSPSFEVSVVRLADMGISDCRGCRVCFNTSDEKCPCHDDLPALMQSVAEADIIVMGSPVYAEDVSGLTKRFIDRMAFNCHRPFLCGKPVYVFTTSGANASNHAVKTLSHAFVSWGGVIVGTHNYKTGAKISREGAEIFKSEVGKAADKLVHSAAGGKVSTYSLIAFNTQKKFWAAKNDDAHKVDYSYWESRGWLDENAVYYKKISCGKLKIAAARLMSCLLNIFMK